MPDSTGKATLGQEDAKLVTLARSARARADAPVAAAVRDLTGRTYVAVQVDLATLQLSALDAAVVMAVASGAEPLEAAAVVGGEDALAAFGQGEGLGALAERRSTTLRLALAAPDGVVREVKEL
ncbi:MAG: hypothetical protein ACTHNT_06065 [Actinomycetales bacterium]